MIVETTSRVLVTVAERDVRDVREELRAALQRTPREIPSRLFYDDRGSRLFELICELPEYYQTRTEHALLRGVAEAVVTAAGASQLVEIGSGAATKTRILLDAMRRTGRLELYAPVDVAEGTVRRVADELAMEYPEIAVHGVVADFATDLRPLLPPREALSPPAADPGAGGGRRLVIFLGSTFGNLSPGPPGEDLSFLRRRRREMEPGDHFLLGLDLVKAVDRLEAAYNDTEGLTAEFNRNILAVVNRLTGSDFAPSAFRHRAFYDRTRRWIEMRLVATSAQRVHLPALDLTLELAAGEEIRTEISAKFDRPGTEALLAAAGFTPAGWFTDPAELFALSLSRS